MRKYIYPIILFGIMTLASVIYPPHLNEILSENFIVIIVLFTLAHFLKLKVARKITVVGDVGAYIMSIFTLSFGTALFSILLFSLIGFVIDLNSKNRVGLLISITDLYIVFIVSYWINLHMTGINLMIRYISIFLLSELIIAIPYLLRFLSDKKWARNFKMATKYYITTDVFFALFFFPFIYLFKHGNMEVYNLYLVNVIIYYFIIYLFSKNMWVHFKYLFSLIKLQEFINFISGKKENANITISLKDFILSFLYNKIVVLEEVNGSAAVKNKRNIWNVNLEDKYMSKLFVGGEGNIELDLYTKSRVDDREQILIDLLIKQLETLSIHKELYEIMEHDFFAILESLIDLIDAKDPYSAGHSKRVSFYAERIAEIVEPENIRRVRLSALLHDIGKLKIPKEILTKEGRLTEHEYDLMKMHPVYGFEMLINLGGLDDILDGVLYHHERLDGSGYPYGVTGASIPNIARIIHIADMYDAMTSDRPYRKRMSSEECFSIMKKEASENKIDAYILNVLIGIIKKRKYGEI